MTRVLIAGLDSVPPELFFDNARFDMPFVRRLTARGAWGAMRSCDPPITVPAWAVMATGRSPSRLGLYGFRHRGGDPYRGASLPTSASVREKALWDYAGAAGRRVIVAGVPPGHPPRTVKGSWVSCFLTPDGAAYARPAALERRIESWLGGRPRFDAEFRKDDRDATLRDVRETTRHKFKLVRRLLAEEPWDLAMFVDIGPDRLHHAFWKYFDPEHPAYERGHKYEPVVRDYYALLDAELRGLFEGLPPDVVVWIVSDHGSKRMAGCFCVNEWLVKEGLLVLKKYPEKVTPLDDCAVDWDKTTAWGWGGYYARIFLNVKGREPRGVVPRKDYEKVRRSLAAKFTAVRGPRGEKWKNRVVLSDRAWKGDPPDMMVYFNGLDHRSAGTLGHGAVHLRENDTGPDDAVHAQDGIFWVGGPGVPDLGRRRIDILDVAPTTLKLLGLPVPKALEGKVLF